MKKTAADMASLGHMAATLAHEFNNILMPVIAYPELMLRTLPEDSPLRRQLEEIGDAGERAFTVVQELCELNHNDEMLTDAVRPDEIVEEYLLSNNFKMLKRQYEFCKVRKHFETESTLVNGSARSMSLVVGKMLLHAARRIRPGDEIEISLKKISRSGGVTGEYVSLSVKDYGRPMSAFEVEQAFEVSPHGEEYLGLGLPVLYGMVKNLNGEVALCSDVEKGTSLQVVLPVYHPAAGMNQCAQVAPSGDGSILVVDDMPRQRDIAMRYLRSFGYQVDAVGNGEEAMEYLKDHHPSLIMLDMVMPGHRDGLDTYTDLAQSYPNIPVVLVSGYGSNDRILEALTRGARDYIQKPYALDAIGRVVRHYIHEHAQN